MEDKEQIHQQCVAWASSGLQLEHKIVCIFIHRLENINPSFLLKINLHLKDYCFLLIQLYSSPALQKSLLTLCNLNTWPWEYNFHFLTCIWFAYSFPKTSRFFGGGVLFSASSPDRPLIPYVNDITFDFGSPCLCHSAGIYRCVPSHRVLGGAGDQT